LAVLSDVESLSTLKGKTSEREKREEGGVARDTIFTGGANRILALKVPRLCLLFLLVKLG
jgi:hypothetical protein